MTDQPAPKPLSTPVFQILLSLADEELHGYAIIREIAERTAGEVRLTASTLYDAIKRLLDARWIAEVSDRPVGVKDDPRRRYYRITPSGLNAARAEAARLERLAAMARARLSPQLRPTSPGSDG